MSENITEYSILNEKERKKIIEILEDELRRIECDVADAMPMPPGYRFVQCKMNICVCQSCRHFRTAYCVKYRRTVRPTCVCDEWLR